MHLIQQETVTKFLRASQNLQKKERFHFSTQKKTPPCNALRHRRRGSTTAQSTITSYIDQNEPEIDLRSSSKTITSAVSSQRLRYFKNHSLPKYFSMAMRVRDRIYGSIQ